MSDGAVLGWGFKFLLTLPLVWLVLLTVLDYCKDLNAIFYSRTLKRIYEKEERIRYQCNVLLENCPIYKALITFRGSSHTDYAKKIGRIPTIKVLKNDIEDSDNHCVIWSLIRGMGVNYQQAAFFEVIVIQFFIAYLMLNAGVQYVAIVPQEWNIYIKHLYLTISVLFFLGPWLVQTYVYQENISSYYKVSYRFILIVCTWIILMLL